MTEREFLQEKVKENSNEIEVVDLDSFHGSVKSSGFGSTCEQINYQAARTNYFQDMSNRLNHPYPSIAEEEGGGAGSVKIKNETLL